MKKKTLNQFYNYIYMNFLTFINLGKNINKYNEISSKYLLLLKLYNSAKKNC
jgi:hypothetical protein